MYNPPEPKSAPRGEPELGCQPRRAPGKGSRSGTESRRAQAELGQGFPRRRSARRSQPRALPSFLPASLGVKHQPRLRSSFSLEPRPEQEIKAFPVPLPEEPDGIRSGFLRK